MSGWGGGYVTDITYPPSYYRQQSPALMVVASLLGGVAAPMPRNDDPVSYLELGCGQGFGALILAASNPAWMVTAIDFNPAHVATARAWAAEAGIGNIRILEADLATLAEDADFASVPEADFVSMHGLWSWVTATVRQGIVRLLRAKVKPGGLVHVSYNALPGWGAAMAMQRVLREGGRRLATRSDRQASEGLKLVRELRVAGAAQLASSAWVGALIERMADLPAEYLAHEYMHDAWAPCFHADVARALAEARLEWVAAANLLENFPQLTLTDGQRALAERFDDPLMCELVKDACITRALRHDVFVRGVRRIPTAQRDVALNEVLLALNISPGDLPFEADMPAGKAQLSPGFYRPIVQALAAGPRSVGELLALPDVAGRRDNPSELTGILIGLDLAEPALRPAAEPAPPAMRFNRMIAATLMRTENPGRVIAAASHTLGAGARASLFDLYVLHRVADGEGEQHVDAWVSDLAGALDAEGRGRLRELLLRCLTVRLPVLRAQGVC